MADPNATLLIIRIQEACRYQVRSVLEAKGVSIMDYQTMDQADPSEPVIGRYEIIVTDASDLDADKVLKSALKSATGPTTASAQRVYHLDNGWSDPNWGIHHH